MRLLIALFAFVATAQAQGVSYIGLCNPTWNCSKTLHTWTGKPITVGWLENSFGNRCKCANRILASRKSKTIRVHLVNSPCLRNKRCAPHDVFYGHTVASANRDMNKPGSLLRTKFERVVTRFARRLSRSRGEVSCYVSPCLECDLNESARNYMLGVVSAAVPQCVLVDNPLQGRCIRGTICEKHGDDPDLRAPCIADNDGTILDSTVDIARYKANTNQCELQFYWDLWMNCNKPMGLFISPRQRSCDASVFTMMKAGEIACTL